VRDPDTPSIYWLTTAAEGLFRFDAESGTFANYRYDDQDLSSISTNRLSSIDVDRNGVMWIGTWSGGVNKLDVDATKFATYSDKPGSVLRLSGSEVWSVAEDERGRIWVGTNPGGLNVIDRANGVVTDWVGAADSPSTPRPEKQWVSAIHEDRSGTMWLGTNSRGLYYRRSGWSEFRRYPNQPSVNGPIWISDIIEDSDGRLWIVSRTSIDLMDAETGDLAPVYPNPIGGFLHGGAEGHDGTMWFVSAGSGLLHVDRNGREIERFVSDPLDPTGLRDNALLSVHPSRAEPGIIWFGGVDVGLGRFDLATRDFKFYGRRTAEQHGLRNPRGRRWDVVAQYEFWYCAIRSRNGLIFHVRGRGRRTV
jgi:ligand-binding sensor domain-containing protein